MAGPIVLDMAMSQYSYGALATHRRAGKMLSVPGGFDRKGEITRDPAEIEATWRPLPIGFWKGSALSIALDVLAAVLSGGQATHTIAGDPLAEKGLSQCFLAISLIGNPRLADDISDRVVAHLHASPVLDGQRVVYPGERTLEKRIENMKHGIPVDPDLWETVRGL
jgi:3-dehydro-L-gulonate 2-dehydrogenase